MIPDIEGGYIKIITDFPYQEIANQKGGIEGDIARENKYLLTRHQTLELFYYDESNSVKSLNQIEIYQLMSFMGNMLVFSTVMLSIVASTYYSDKSFIMELWEQLNEDHQHQLDTDEI